MTAIEVRGLTKTYGETVANDDLSFAVEDGEILGCLGPNGAGKTTCIRTLMGFQSPTEGTATVLGADVRDPAAALVLLGVTGALLLAAIAVFNRRDL